MSLNINRSHFNTGIASLPTENKISIPNKKHVNVMDKVNEADKTVILQKIGSMFDNNTEISISDEGLDALINSFFSEANEADKIELKTRTTDIYSFNPFVSHASNNIITSRNLTESLDGADENVLRAVGDIIHRHLLNYNVSGMTEDERQSMIALGVEKAKYLAANHFDANKAKQFLSAIDTIAKWGMNGKTDENGIVSFDIRKGPVVEGANQLHEVVKSQNPELYKKWMDTLYESQALKEKAKIGELKLENIRYKLKVLANNFIDLQKQAIKWYQSPDGSGKSPHQQWYDEYNGWKNKMESTALPTAFSQSDVSNQEAFFDSIMNQNESSNTLDSDYLKEDLQKFIEQLK